VPQPLRYMAREYDVTGLYQVRARWYDAQYGRFISEDPIGLAGGINPYAYAAGNPVSSVTPPGYAPTFEKATDKQHALVAPGITVPGGGGPTPAPFPPMPSTPPGLPMGPGGSGGRISDQYTFWGKTHKVKNGIYSGRVYVPSLTRIYPAHSVVICAARLGWFNNKRSRTCEPQQEPPKCSIQKSLPPWS
jgi:RHS repeat-associated protein